MFDISQEIIVPVKVRVTTPGKPDHVLNVEFEVIPQDEVNDLLETGGVKAVLERVVRSVGGIKKGQEEVDPVAAVPMAINHYLASAGLWAAFTELKSKNLRANQSK